MSREDLVNLYETIIKIETIEECEEFLNDLLTFKEINAISKFKLSLENWVRYS